MARVEIDIACARFIAAARFSVALGRPLDTVAGHSDHLLAARHRLFVTVPSALATRIRSLSQEMCTGSHSISRLVTGSLPFRTTLTKPASKPAALSPSSSKISISPFEPRAKNLHEASKETHCVAPTGAAVRNSETSSSARCPSRSGTSRTTDESFERTATFAEGKLARSSSIR
eukprot:Amastigsp_a174805_1663.p3 type:complete len:174 gc:universal Amastigsp_a174805_1663:1054-533(-)